MKIIIRMLSLIIFCLYLSFSTDTVSYAQNNIQFTLSEDGVLVFEGKGILNYKTYRGTYVRENADKVKKIIVKEGITELGEQAFSCFGNLEQIELPNSLAKIGTESFYSGCDSLKKITFGNSLKEIGSGAFWGCEALESLTIPDTVEKIGSYAFWGCSKLKKLVLPASLKSWNKNNTEQCVSLKKIVNRSRISCKIDNGNGYRIWRINGKKINVIPKGKTATSKGKKIPIVYKLLGGKKTGKLPRTYEYGTVKTIPLNVSRKNDVMMGWILNNYEVVRQVGPTNKKVVLEPCWCKYKVTSPKKGNIQLLINWLNKDISYSDYDIQYSQFSNMKQSKTLCVTATQKKHIISGLESGKTYYIRFRTYDDAESSGGMWMGKRKIVVR